MGKNSLSDRHRLRTGVTPCADPLRTMRRHVPHHVPTHSAPCPDTLRIMRGRTPHHVPCPTPV
ncbi:MAG: hypothetical protein K2O48_03115 [Prevotella sp.]|nr:hypothetical protein [Prevotella sp.]MDE7085663.1 hypothetical protein [Prevotella sp.]